MRFREISQADLLSSQPFLGMVFCSENNKANDWTMRPLIMFLRQIATCLSCSRLKYNRFAGLKQVFLPS